MIRLFRKIRHKLLSDNNYGIYILYATGEIVLVMIGILLALQIDNWNDIRKERILENKYLTSIKRELEDNIQGALLQISYSEFQQKNGELILLALADTSRINAEDLAVAIEHIGWHAKLIYIRDVWDELYATGNIEIITNLDLKNDLLVLYRNFEQSVKVEELEWIKYNFGIRKIVGEILPPAVRLDIAAHLRPEKYFGGIEMQIPTLDVMLARLKNLEELNGNLTDVIMARRVSQMLLSEDIKLMKEIIEKLEDDLNK